MEPQPQRLTAVLENCAGRRQTLPLALPTMPQTAIRVPRIHRAASVADKSIGPANPLQIFPAVLLGRKPFEKFLENLRERGFFPSLSRPAHHRLWALESISYPDFKMSFSTLRKTFSRRRERRSSAADRSALPAIGAAACRASCCRCRVLRRFE